MAEKTKKAKKRRKHTITGRSLLYMVLSIPMAAIVIWMHRTNIQRLRDGNENKFSFKRAA